MRGETASRGTSIACSRLSQSWETTGSSAYCHPTHQALLLPPKRSSHKVASLGCVHPRVSNALSSPTRARDGLRDEMIMGPQSPVDATERPGTSWKSRDSAGRPAATAASRLPSPSDTQRANGATTQCVERLRGRHVNGNTPACPQRCPEGPIGRKARPLHAGVGGARGIPTMLVLDGAHWRIALTAAAEPTRGFRPRVSLDQPLC
jgi:hypothetical protein